MVLGLERQVLVPESQLRAKSAPGRPTRGRFALAPVRSEPAEAQAELRQVCQAERQHLGVRHFSVPLLPESSVG